MKLYGALIILVFNFHFAFAKKRDDRPIVKALEGDTISLFCDHGSVNTDTLYAVKWYKDEKEFFRNYPKAENPVKVYPIDGFTLETPAPSPWQVVLKNVNESATGKYTCMVVDYPRYRTIYRSTQVEITPKNDTLHQQHPPDVPGRFSGASNLETYPISAVLLLFASCFTSILMRLS